MHGRKESIQEKGLEREREIERAENRRDREREDRERVSETTDKREKKTLLGCLLAHIYCIYTCNFGYMIEVSGPTYTYFN